MASSSSVGSCVSRGPGGGVLHPAAPPRAKAAHTATASPSADAAGVMPLTLAAPGFLRVQYILQVLSHAFAVVLEPPPAADIGLLELRRIAERVAQRLLGPLVGGLAGGAGEEEARSQ